MCSLNRENIKMTCRFGTEIIFKHVKQLPIFADLEALKTFEILNHLILMTQSATA